MTDLPLPPSPPPASGPQPSIEELRAEFPILSARVGDNPLAYLDNAATTQKPQAVIDALSRFYQADNANIHRGVHALSQRATDAYDEARSTVARFLRAPDVRGVLFTRGTTEAINLVAHGMVHTRLREGDNIVLSGMEHHANIVPWQIHRESVGFEIRVIPVHDNGELDLAAAEDLIDARTRLVGCVHVSNALGTINPVEDLVRVAHDRGALFLLDAAQAAPHLALDVESLGCDFLAFSGHKVYGPTGIGVLWGRPDILESLPPYQGGGDMIRSVSFERTTFKGIPDRFEAGTPAIAQAIGLAEALRYLGRLGLTWVAQREDLLLRAATEAVGRVPGVRIWGTAPRKCSVLSFTMEQAHPHDIGTFLDADGIAIRAGHHCTQPLMRRFGLSGTARASFSFYNTLEEVDRLAASLHRIARFFGP